MTNSSNLPSIRTIVNQFGLLPDKKYTKRYGQNFIFDESITNRIAIFARLPKDAIVLEIGPGPGGLTRAILNQNPARVVSVEYDVLCIEALSYLQKAYPNFHLISKDALQLTLSEILNEINEPQDTKLHIVSNLPYNIGTELLVRWFSQITTIESMTLMFQKEVAMRIFAKPDTKDYGRLSILAQLLCDVEHGFDLPPSAFTPAPKVDSSVIHLKPKIDAASVLPHLNALSHITNICFQQRRKQIRGTLKTIFQDRTHDVLESIEASPDLRPENLTPEQFLKLALCSVAIPT